MRNKNRQFYCYKFETDRLKRFNYDIDINFNQAKRNGEVIAIADNQILRVIRDIKHINFSKEVIEDLYRQRDMLKNAPASRANTRAIVKVQEQINHLLFFPDYVAIKVNKLSHYDYIFKHGLKINGERYWRLSCSAGQARNSTVLLCSESIIGEVKDRLNNGRDLTVPIAPSKLNAYFGLYSSATFVVREPRFAVIPDYENEVEFDANYVTETDYDSDDIIETKRIKQKICRTDGMGLISPDFADKWAEDLNLDYTPSQFIIRQSFLKGLVTRFDFKKFCEEKNNGNYLINTIYKDEEGNPVKADLRECDLIISESQFKLWNSYKSQEDYIEKYHANNIQWGVAQYSPKEYDEVSFLNYQFIQSLELNKEQIKTLCSLFEEWISGVTYNNPDYTILFLTGAKASPERLKEYLRSWDIYWIKALVLNRDIFKDPYIQKKIYRYVQNYIRRACLGTIPVKGNYQYMITDPYAFMEHVCGKEPKGLLGEQEFYSQYWIKKNVLQVDAMRAPLTHFSEHVILNFKDTDETNEWYKWCSYGIILNWHGYEVDKFAGSDCDGDICLTVNNQTMIDGIIRGENPVVYDPQKPQKIIPTDEDLQRLDKFGMGSIIGQITNKGASAYALLPLLEQKYGRESKEYQLTLLRLKETCKAQSCEIDKTKLGRKVKGIPTCWINRLKTDNPELLLNKRPYFFRYLYPETNIEYKKYIEEQDFLCQKNFRKPLQLLFAQKELSPQEKQFIDNYYKWLPVIDSNSTMNLLCKHIEEFNCRVKKHVNNGSHYSDYYLYKHGDYIYNSQDKREVLEALNEYLVLKMKDKTSGGSNKEENRCELSLKEMCLSKLNNIWMVVNILVDYFYRDNHSLNKDILWNSFGKEISENAFRNSNKKVSFPFEDENGDIEYLGKKYSVKEICFE